jgi:ABC-type nitrate/sulfonate/bicarbonate transport system substrate-binding protein
MTLALAGCGGKSHSSSAPRPAVEVGYSFAYDAGAVADRIAFARLRRRTGIAVRIRDLGGVANAVVALVRGNVQLATMPYPTAIRAAEEKAHLRIVLGATMAPDVLLVCRPGIRSVAELRGRRVVFDEPGLDGETLVHEALSAADVPLSAVKTSFLDESSARAAELAAGRADAAVLDRVDFERLRARGLRVGVLARLSEYRPRSAQTVWVVSERYERTHRRLVRRLVHGLLDGYAFVYTPTGRRAWVTLARRTVLRGKEAALAPGMYSFYRRVGYWPLRTRPVTPEQHARTVRFWLAAGQLDEYVPFSHVWDESFWRREAKR